MTSLDYDAFKTPNARPMVCLTAYTTPMAQLLDPHVDMLLVGDSLAMVIYGHDTTRNIDIETMIRHGQAVVRGSQKSCVVVDMPYGSYENDKDIALNNAQKILKETGCDAVKLEGGVDIAQTIAYLVDHHIDVIGHIGLMPQRVFGQFKARGKDSVDEKIIMEDAHAVAQAGAKAIVIEAVMEELAQQITGEICVPTIGIGASAACDGQILVTEDMLGLSPGRKPKFVHEFAHLHTQICDAAKTYASQVSTREFPYESNTYKRIKPKAA